MTDTIPTLLLMNPLKNKFERFLNLNYPCDCVDVKCSGNKFEAEELVAIVQQFLETSSE